MHNRVLDFAEAYLLAASPAHRKLRTMTPRTLFPTENPHIEAQRISWRLAQGKGQEGDTRMVFQKLREGLSGKN